MVPTCGHLIFLDPIYEQLGCPLEYLLNEGAEILVRPGQGEEIEELLVGKKVKAGKRHSLFLEEFGDPALEDAEFGDQFFEHLDPALDHQVVGGLGVLERAPHDPPELVPDIVKLVEFLPENLFQLLCLEDWVQINPEALGLNPSLQI